MDFLTHGQEENLETSFLGDGSGTVDRLKVPEPNLYVRVTPNVLNKRAFGIFSLCKV